MNCTQPLKIPSPSELLTRANMDNITAPINIQGFLFKQSTKAEADSDSSDSESCNIGSEDEMPPSGNPTVTRHLGQRRLKIRFF